MTRDLPSPRIATSARDGLYFVIIGSLIFLALGWVLTHGEKPAIHDFRTAYYSGKALLEHRDPYSEQVVEQLYSQESPPTGTPDPDRIVVTRNPYLPSCFALTSLLALFPEFLALALWIAVIGISFLLASFFVWQACAQDAKLSIGILTGYILATSASLFYFGNPAGFAVPLCILGCISFISERFIPLGIAAFAVSLAFKPHDGGLILLYFLLACALYRKRALQTVLCILVLTLPMILWLYMLSPHWIKELSSNMAAFSGPGRTNDPRAPHGTLMMTNLQTVTSFFWNDSKIYDSVALLICGPLLLLWVWKTVRTRATQTNTWLALASISALSVLPVYHRQYDAKLIMLQFPALSLLLTRKHRLRWIAFAVTALATFLSGDLPWLVLIKVAARLRNLGSPFAALMADVMLNFPVPLALLAAGCFYLWLYVCQSDQPDSLLQPLA